MPLLMQPGNASPVRCGPSAVIPTAQLIAAGSLANPLTGFCSRCEHQYQLTVGASSTTTTGAANTQGATALTVASGTSFSTVGALVVIDSGDLDGGPEVVTVSWLGWLQHVHPDREYTAGVTHAAGATVQ